MAKSRYNVVYYWTGGRVEGKWSRSVVRSRTEWPTRKEVNNHCLRLDRCGYVNHPGVVSVGPPEGPPSDAKFKLLGL